MAVNLRLKALRVGHGLYQKDMCMLLGLKAEGTYSQKENGKRSFTQNEIKIISDAFNLSGDQIREIFFDQSLFTKDKLHILGKADAISLSPETNKTGG